MLGKPKYKYEETVEFDMDGLTIAGKVHVIDAYGTFFDCSDVSYDIMVEHSPHYDGQPCLYKHIGEKCVRKAGA